MKEKLTWRTRLRVVLLWLKDRKKCKRVLGEARRLQHEISQPLQPRECRYCLTCLREKEGVNIVAGDHNLVHGQCEHCWSTGNVVRIMLPPKLPVLRWADWSWDGLVRGELDK